MSEQGGDHKVMRAALNQTGGKRVAQVVWPEVIDLGPFAGRRKALLNGFQRLAVAIRKEPFAGAQADIEGATPNQVRVKLSLQALAEGASLPLNYQHQIAALIYATLGSDSAAFAARLHDEGYSAEGRVFRLFTFSRLAAQRSRISGDRLMLLDPTVTLQLSSPSDDFIEHFVSGLFLSETFTIAGARFRLAQAETLPPPVFTGRMRFRTLSPVTETIGEGRKHPRFLSPEDDWSAVIRRNLLRKHAALYGHEPADTSLRWEWDTDYLAAAARRGRRASVLVDIRDTKIRGWLAPFTVEGSAALIELGYEAGFGARNSMGFGMAEPA